MATLYTHRTENIAKTWLLMGAFGVVVTAIGWAISSYYHDPGILPVAVIIALGMNLFSYWFSDKIVIAMAGAKPADGPQYEELNNVVENLVITAGLPKPKVYIINDPAPNAFATGRNKNHAAVAVTTGLLNMMNRTELEGVLAHELSHIGNRDMIVSTIAVVLVGFVTLAADFFWRSTYMFGNRDREERQNPILLAIIAIVLVILAPIIATLLQLAISRRREFLADASGALLTRYPEGLASALAKNWQLCGAYAPSEQRDRTPLHFQPFGPGAAKSFITRLFSTHPPVEERIKALLGNKAAQFETHTI
jgi:heat shock protein HtpX